MERRLLSCLLVFVLASWAIQPATADVNAWSRTGPGLVFTTTPTFHPTDPLIAFVADESGLFRSDDSGVTWSLVNSRRFDGQMRVAIHPTQPSTLLVNDGYSDGLLISRDAGVSFSTIAGLPRGVYVGAQFSLDGQRIFAAHYNSVWVSTDGAATWTEHRSGLPVETQANNSFQPPSLSTLIADPVTPTTVWVSTHYHGVYRSTDGGITWSARNTGLPMPNGYHFSLSAADPTRLWVWGGSGLFTSTDGGASWTASNNGITGSATTRIPSAHPTNPNIAYVSSSSPARVFRTVDGGASWQGIAFNSYAGYAFAPGNPSLILSRGQNAPRSADGGVTWARGTGLTGGVVDVLVPGVGTASIQAMIYNQLVYVSEDDGASWLQRASQPATRLIVDPVDPTRIVTSHSSFTTILEYRDNFLNSTSFDVGHPVLDLAMSVSPPGIYYAATGVTGVRRSSDGGATWTTVDSLPGTGTSYFNEVAVDPTDSQIVLAASWNEGMYRSTDGGTTWTLILPYSSYGMFNAIEFDPDSPQTLYAHSGSERNGLLRSTDKGATWVSLSKQPCGDAVDSARHPEDPDTLITATTLGFCRSLDGGANWELIDRGLGRNPAFGLSVGFSAADPEHVYFGANSLGLAHMRLRSELDVSLGAPPSTPLPGASFDLPITFRNQGPLDVAKPALTVTATNGSIAQLAVTGMTCSVSGATGTCTAQKFSAGTQMTGTVRVTTGSVGGASVTASGAAREPELSPSDNSASHAFTVVQPSGPDLSVSLTGGASSIQVGKSLTLSFSVTNSGPDAATASSFTLPVPSLLKAGAVKLTKVTGVKGMSCTKGSLIRCTFGALPVGQTRRGTITLKAGKVAGTATLTASAAGSPTDPDASDNSTTRTVTITPKP